MLKADRCTQTFLDLYSTVVSFEPLMITFHLYFNNDPVIRSPLSCAFYVCVDDCMIYMIHRYLITTTKPEEARKKQPQITGVHDANIKWV